MNVNNDIKNLKPQKGTFINGLYHIQHPEKYIGDVMKCIFRSSYEKKFMIYCDSNDRIVKWASEPFPIVYFNPVDKKEHRYFVDFYIKLEQEDGTIQEYLVEVKPKAKLQPPILKGHPTNRTINQIKLYNAQCKEYITNWAKFKAIKVFCELHNKKFLLVTEDFLFGENYKKGVGIEKPKKTEKQKQADRELKKKRKAKKEMELRIKSQELNGKS